MKIIIENADARDFNELANLARQGKIHTFYMTDEEERPQGEWINTSPYDDKGECSLCCYLSKKYYKYCPNCGADMKGKEE